MQQIPSWWGRGVCSRYLAGGVEGYGAGTWWGRGVWSRYLAGGVEGYGADT